MRIPRKRSALVLVAMALASVMVLVLSVAFASAGEFTETHSDSIPATDTDWATPPGTPPGFPDPLEFDQFNPAKGTLTQVKITYDSALTGSMAAENFSTSSACEVTLDIGAVVTLDTTDGVLLSSLGEAATEPLEIYDGVIDFAGPSGVTVAPISKSDQQVKVITDLAATAPFVGTGTITLDSAAVGASSATGCGNVIQQFINQAAVDVEIEYTFQSNPDIDIEKATNGEDADSPTGPLVPVGDPVAWTYVVTNTGDVPLFDVVVTDDVLGVIPGPDSGDVNTNGVLETTETWTYLANGIAALGQYENIADVVGSPLVGGNDVTDLDPSHYFGIDPAAEIAIEADATNEVGSPHEFTVTVMEDPLGNGDFVAAEGETVDVTYVSANGADANAPDSCVTDAAGQCTVTINSNAAGQITATASSDVDVAGTTVSVATDGVAPNSGPAVKTYVDARIGIDPDATNLVTDPHTFTTTVWVDDGSGAGFVAYEGAAVEVTLTNGGGAVANPAGPFNGLSDANGEYDVTFTSATPGTVTGHATAVATVGGVELTRETDGIAPNTDDAIKTFIDPAAKIEIEADATNEVGSPHEFTVTVMEDPIGEGDFVAAEGETVDVTYVSSNGADANAPDSCVTDAAGQCNVTINSSAAGMITATASSDVDVSGTDVTVTTDGVAPNSGPAVKTYVDAKIEIDPDATNLVTDPHTFTTTVMVDDGSGAGFVAYEGAAVEVTLTNGGSAVANPAGPFNGLSDVNGEFDVTFTSATPGTVTGHATAVATVGGVDLTRETDDTASNSGDAIKTFVAPAIHIEKATNGEDADTPTGPAIPVGDPVVWTYVVTNTGDVPLSDVVVTDDILGVIPGPDSGDVNTNGILETTEIWLYSANGIAEAGQYANVGMVIGVPQLGPPVTDEDPSHYIGEVFGGEGCTPGYWKQSQHFWAWTNYDQDDSYAAVFGVDYDKTLLQALKTGGGAEKALGRHSVAALLNAASGDVDYAYTEAQIIALVQDAWATGDYNAAKDLLEYENEMGCPIGRAPRS